jgi:UDP-2,3-diacylglucosamine hydrolase
LLSYTSNAVVTGNYSEGEASALADVEALVSSACLFQIRCLAQPPLHTLGIIAGNGVYPRLLADSARTVGVKKIVAAAFTGETDPALTQHVDLIEWMRVGQLGRLLKFFRDQEIHHAIMAGQIAPKNLFDLRPDWKALLLLTELKERNAESIFAAIADELAKVDVDLLPATTFLEEFLAPAGLIAGPKLTHREEEDVDLGWKIAKEIARLDIGQTVIVKNGTVVAVEALEGTNEIIKRGSTLARKSAVMVKVAKPNQDMRFDVPVIGVETIRIAETKLRVIAIESAKTLLLERDAIIDLANRANISIVAR